MNKMTCAFTGHRPSRFPWAYDETDQRCIALKEILTGEIMRLADIGVTNFLSGMAEGVDTWASVIVLALREKNPLIKLHCILPCKTQADDWSSASQTLYRSILEQADSIVYVSRNHHSNCMMERNRFMVDHASILVAIYQETPRSGTAATIHYARKMGREIIIVAPLSHTLTHEGAASEQSEVSTERNVL